MRRMINQAIASERPFQACAAAQRFLESPNDGTFTVVFNIFTPQLISFFSRPREPALSEDFAQDVMLIVYRKADQLRDRTLFRAWLFKVARSLLSRHYEKRSREADTIDLEKVCDSMLTSSRMPAATLAFEFEHWMSSLDEPEQEALRLRFIEDWQYHEIAASKAIPIGTVQWRMFNAKKGTYILGLFGYYPYRCQECLSRSFLRIPASRGPCSPQFRKTAGAAPPRLAAHPPRNPPLERWHSRLPADPVLPHPRHQSQIRPVTSRLRLCVWLLSILLVIVGSLLPGASPLIRAVCALPVVCLGVGRCVFDRDPRRRPVRPGGAVAGWFSQHHLRYRHAFDPGAVVPTERSARSRRLYRLRPGFQPSWPTGFSAPRPASGKRRPEGPDRLLAAGT